MFSGGIERQQLHEMGQELESICRTRHYQKSFEVTVYKCSFLYIVLLNLLPLLSAACPTFTYTGCYSKLAGEDNILNTMLIDGRDLGSKFAIRWYSYNRTLSRLVCHCADMAQKRDFKTIGVQFYGECWGSKKSFEEISEHLHEVKYCVNGDFRTCVAGDFPCSGTDKTTTLYKVAYSGESKVNGGYTDWSTWSSCPVSCGLGVQARTRTCTNPSPSGSGLGCGHLGKSKEVRPCATEECEKASGACNVISDEDEYYSRIITAPRTSSIKLPFCTTERAGDAAVDKPYKIKTKIISENGRAGMGMYFNSKDSLNYEYAYVLVENKFYCYTTGLVRNGKNIVKEQSQEQCERLFKAEEHVQLEVDVKDGKATFKADGHKLVQYITTTKTIRSGGVLVKILQRSCQVAAENFSIVPMKGSDTEDDDIKDDDK